MSTTGSDDVDDLLKAIADEPPDATWQTLPVAVRAQVMAAFLSRDTGWMNNLRQKIYPQFDTQIMAYLGMLIQVTKKLAAQKGQTHQ